MNEQRISRRQFVSDAAALAAGVSAAGIVGVGNAAGADTAGILNYSSDMEYRRCGKTEWMVSSVCLGGHWKRLNQMVPGVFQGASWLSADLADSGFQRNRYDVVTRCIERGINYIDACTHAEILAYSKALEGRREQMYLGWSWYEREARNRSQCNGDALMKVLDDSLKEANQQYVDLYRIVCGVDGRRGNDGEWVFPHTLAESEGIAEGLDRAKRSGKARMTGISSHDRPWLKYMMETFPDQIDVVITPYTAKTRVLPADPTGFFAALARCDCGFFGIKPFASNALFQGDSSPGNPHQEEDNRLARLAVRFILCNPRITAPIPGLINVEQVDNVALAVVERRELDVTEQADLDRAMDRAWANLPRHYQWLRDWEWV
ncbi:MAG: aldo/keto reductase [Planctomycetota bacterium]|jgi:aryl-alcohol dehydrogenase-like predicted oxidoreductase